MLPRQLLLAGCVVATVLSLAGCSVRGDDPPEPTPNDDVFVIVTPTPGTPPPESQNRPTRYIVRPGDNLTMIAARLGVTVQALQEINGIENPDTIYAGQVLMVPTPMP